MERNWQLYEWILETIGGDELSLAICKALSLDEMNEVLDYIATCYGMYEYDEKNSKY